MMGLDELVACIKTIQKRVRENGNFLQKNETRTRMVLIDPLLSALGWDITNPGVVQAEFEVGGKLADYALLGQDGKPVMVLEAKRLGAKLDTHLWQMINYANMAGIQYAGITDGDHWEIYKVFEQSKLEDRRKLKISIVGTPVYESALQLLLLWNSNLGSTQPIQANVPLLIKKGATGVKETKIAKPSTSSGWVPLSDFKAQPGTACPSAIRFWDGSERRLEFWYEMLCDVVEKLYAEDKLTLEDLPISSSKWGYLVHSEPVHPTGNAFRRYKQISGSPLFVYTSLSAVDIRKYVTRLLTSYGLSHTDVYLCEGK